MPDTPQGLVVSTAFGAAATHANIARVYDAVLGGKDNFEVDRQAAAALERVLPHQSAAAWANRRWLQRVVRYLAGTVGVDQFLDIGAGLPIVGNTHEVAQQQNPQATVVYVDNDPICIIHGRALLEHNEQTHFVQSDMTVPEKLLNDSDVQKYVDFERPIGLLLCGILHHIPDTLDPQGLALEYISKLPAGSYVAITHFWDPAEEDVRLHEAALAQQEVLTDKSRLASGWYRTRAEIAGLFGSLDIIEPGIVELDDWWPTGPPHGRREDAARLLLGGVGRKAMANQPAGR